MMPSSQGSLLLAAVAGAAAVQHRGDHFGPGNCVSVARSPASTCVLTTKCEGHDTSSFEFAFDCRLPNGGAVERHSFGVGGFDAQEEYDTEVKCDMCTMPGNMPKLAPSASRAEGVARQQTLTDATTKAPMPAKQPVSAQAQQTVAQAAQPAAEVQPVQPVQQEQPVKEAAEPIQNSPFAVKHAPATVQGRHASKMKMKKATGGHHVHAWSSPSHQANNKAAKPMVHHFMAHKGAGQQAAHHAAHQAVATQDSDQDWAQPPSKEDGGKTPVKYGPKSCVSTWRSDNGHCIVQTDCKEVQIDTYDFGLVCVDKVGKPIRHLFGKGSFDPVETFDTLIKCHQCLGLEDVPDEYMLNNEVLGLAHEVKDLEGMMKDMTGSITKLNAKVFAAPAPAAAMPQSPAAAVALHSAEARSDHAKSHHAKGHHLSKHSTKRHLRHKTVEVDEEQQEESSAEESQSATEEQQTTADDQQATEEASDQQQTGDAEQSSTEEQAIDGQETDEEQTGDAEQSTQEQATDEGEASDEKQEEQAAGEQTEEQAEGQQTDQQQVEQQDDQGVEADSDQGEATEEAEGAVALDQSERSVAQQPEAAD